MNRCDQARRLFDAYWDDEVTQAEREWLEGHLAACPGCRERYEQLARTLETVGSLPRVEVAKDLAERALGAARRAQGVPDRLAVAPATPRWVPVTAAAALVLVTAALLLPTLSPFFGSPGAGSRMARALPEPPVAEPRLVATAGRPAAEPGAAPTLADSLFDHSQDVEFILDPVVLHRGRARAAGNLPAGVQTEQTVISF
jgi:anti-sigma factor RsiW